MADTVNVRASSNVLGLRDGQEVTALVNDVVTDALASGYLVDVGGAPSASVVVLPLVVDDWHEPLPPAPSPAANQDYVQATVTAVVDSAVTAEQERADGVYVRWNGVTITQPDGTVIPIGGGGGGTAPVTVLEVAAWGNSLTAQGPSFGTKWVDGLASDTTLTAFNGGISGQSSTEIAVRQGGRDLQITVPGNVIPASGSVQITVANVAVWRGQVTSFTGKAAGVDCVVSHDAGSAPADPTDPDSLPGPVTFTLTRSVAGNPVPCPPGTLFHCTDGDAHRGAEIVTLWPMTNNPSQDPTLAIGLADLDSMVDNALDDGTGLVVIATDHLRTGETKTPIKKLMNSLVRGRYTGRPVVIADLERVMGGWALVLAGLNATAADLQALAYGQAPPSLMSDAGSVKTHFNTAGYAIVRRVFKQAVALSGKVPGMYPAVAPDAVGAAAVASAITGNSFTGTAPAAIDRATAYHWEYRKQGGDGKWLYGPNSTGLAGNFTNLDGATNYEYRYTPHNDAGPGVASAIATMTTTGAPPVVYATDSGSGPATTNVNGRNTDQLAVAGQSPSAGQTAKLITVGNVFAGKDASGVFYNSGGGGAQTVPLIDLGVIEAAVEGTIVSLPSTGYVGFVLRGIANGVSSAYGYYIVFTSTGSMRYVKAPNAAAVILNAPGTVAPNLAKAGDRIKAVVSGAAGQPATLTCWINGTPQTPYVDNSSPVDGSTTGGTKFGYWENAGGQLRDFVYKSY